MLLVTGKTAGVHRAVRKGVDPFAFLQTQQECAFVHVAVDVGVDPCAVDGVTGEIAFVQVAVGVQDLALAFLQQVCAQLPFVNVPVGVGDLLPVQVHFGGNTVGIDDTSLIRLAVVVHQTQKLDLHIVRHLYGNVPHAGKIDGRKNPDQADHRTENDGQHHGSETAVTAHLAFLRGTGIIILHDIVSF